MAEDMVCSCISLKNEKAQSHQLKVTQLLNQTKYKSIILLHHGQFILISLNIIKMIRTNFV